MDSALTDRTPPASAPMAPASEAPAPARRPHAPGTRVRQLVFSSKAERHAATLLLTRSFAYDGNVQRYLGSVKAPGSALTGVSKFQIAHHADLVHRR